MVRPFAVILALVVGFVVLGTLGGAVQLVTGRDIDAVGRPGVYLLTVPICVAAAFAAYRAYRWFTRTQRPGA